jgi:exosortase
LAKFRADISILNLDEPTGKWFPLLKGGVMVFLLLGLLGALYRVILQDLVRDWLEDPNYSHGFLVPLFSGYLIWRQRKKLKMLVPLGSWTGLPLLLGGIGMIILGEIGADNFLTRSSLVIILAGLVLFHLGKEIFRELVFALCFLFFMVPLPAILFYAVTFPLQRLAAQNAAWALDLLGVPVLLDGNVLHLSHITLGITEACSGIRSLVSLLALAVAWAYLTLNGTWAKIALVASAVPITIVANAGRVVTTGLLGQWLGVAYAQGFFHTFSGWLIFLFAFVGLLGVHCLIRLVRPIRYERVK